MLQFRIKIINANTELIPEAPNRQATLLTVAGTDRKAIVEAQVAEPSIERIVLCRTPPVTVEANVAVISIVVAVTARKRRK